MIVMPAKSFVYSMQKNGSSIDSPRQMGHFPGFLNLTLFAKTKPHFLHTAGVMTRFLLFLLTVF